MTGQRLDYDPTLDELPAGYESRGTWFEVNIDDRERAAQASLWRAVWAALEVDLTGRAIGAMIRDTFGDPVTWSELTVILRAYQRATRRTPWSVKQTRLHAQSVSNTAEKLARLAAEASAISLATTDPDTPRTAAASFGVELAAKAAADAADRLAAELATLLEVSSDGPDVRTIPTRNRERLATDLALFWRHERLDLADGTEGDGFPRFVAAIVEAVEGEIGDGSLRWLDKLMTKIRARHKSD